MRATLAILLAVQLSFAAPLPARSRDQNPSGQASPVQPPPPSPRQQKQRQAPLIRANVSLVVVDVEVTDSSGNPVKNLEPNDFTVTEDGKPQKIAKFVYADVEGFAKTEAASGAAGKPVVVPVAAPPGETTAIGATVRNRRVILLFFDLTSLPIPELRRARTAAIHFVKDQMTPADLVGVVVLGNELGLLSDFTNDKETLLTALDRLQPGVDSQLADLASAAAQEGETSSTEDVQAAWTPDETEFNVFNTDRKLEAMQDLANLLGTIPGKKVVMQFTAGITQTGEENRTAVEAATDAANRANVSFYNVDSRGLLAEVPGGDASQAGATGTSMFSGDTVLSQVQSRQDSRDTLFTLADDTGGRAFFDMGDLSKAFTRVQQDTAGYYLLGYIPTNTKANGQWRSIKVKIDRRGLNLRYRTGYFAPRDYAHFTTEDRQQQLLEALQQQAPVLELPIALETPVFYLNNREAFVPIDAKLPASTLEWAQKKGSHEDQFDFATQVRDLKTGRDVAPLLDTVTVQLGAEHYAQYASRSLLYQGGLVLAPGSYSVKFVARENATGRIGSFQENLEVPAPVSNQLGVSSVLLSSQLVPVEKTAEVKTTGLAIRARGGQMQSPLEVAGERIVPSVTNTFTQDQTLYVYFQAYLPSKADSAALRAGLLFFRDGMLVSRSPLVEPAAIDPKTHTASFRIRLPLQRMTLGRYKLEAVTVVAGTPLAAFSPAYLAVLAPAQAANAAPAPGK